MPTSRSSSSSSNTGTELTSRNVRGTSEISQTTSQHRDRSPTNTIEGNSIAETNSLRSASPTPSHNQTASIHTTTSQQQLPPQTTAAGGIPIIRPPTIQQSTGTGVGVFGPQHPRGNPIQPPLNINVAAAQQQYQQRGGPAQQSSSSSTSSGTSGSQSSPGSVSIQQPSVANVQRAVHPTNVAPNRNVPPPGPQFPNQIPPRQVYNELLGPDAFKDVILDIDYGALGSLNVAFQSPGDFSGGQLPPGINVRPAYTTVDSLNYQQHMFNTSRTIYGDGSGDNQQYDYGAYNAGNQSEYNYQGAGHFDAAKAIFNQVDTNHDGSISREEFQQWAQGGQSNAYGHVTQQYEQHHNQHQYEQHQHQQQYEQHHHQPQQSINQATVLEGNNPAIANILHQSGLAQTLQR